MTEETLMRRIAGANPVATAPAPPDAHARFAAIIAEPGDPRLNAARTRRNRLVPVAGLALAGVAAAAVLISGNPSHHAAGQITVGGAHAQETAAIIRHLRTHLADSDLGYIATYTSGQSTGVSWTDPQTHVEYSRSTTTDAHGTTVDWTALKPAPLTSAGQEIETGRSVSIDQQAHTYDASDDTTYSYYPAATQPPGLASSPAQITRALESGTVRQTGTMVVNGHPAIELSVSGFQGYELDVDSATDQPLRLTITPSAGQPITTDLTPATASSVADLRSQPIPAGYSAKP